MNSILTTHPLATWGDGSISAFAYNHTLLDEGVDHIVRINAGPWGVSIIERIPIPGGGYSVGDIWRQRVEA